MPSIWVRHQNPPLLSSVVSIDRTLRKFSSLGNLNAVAEIDHGAHGVEFIEIGNLVSVVRPCGEEDLLNSHAEEKGPPPNKEIMVSLFL